MKTTKLFLSILGVALATLSFGQKKTPGGIPVTSDTNIEQSAADESELFFYAAEFNKETGRIMHWVNRAPRRNSPKVNDMESHTPLVYRICFAKDVDVIYEESLILEEWMIQPFKVSVAEPDLVFEEWMTIPWI